MLPIFQFLIKGYEGGGDVYIYAFETFQFLIKGYSDEDNPFLELLSFQFLIKGYTPSDSTTSASVSLSIPH